MTTLTFLTLLLGLTTGIQPVSLDADGPVARVEVLLDGESCGERSAPPWELQCDFGDELAPHRLEGRAYDAEGRQVASVLQLVNLAPRQSAVELTLERDGEAVARALRLAWRSVAFDAPTSVEVRLDGEPLPVEDPARVALPALDPEELHVAVAQLTFEDGSTARATLTFGGRWGEAVSSQNTAVPVLPEPEHVLRRPQDAAAALITRDGGKTLRTVDVEGGTADLVAVVDGSATPELVGMRGRRSRAAQINDEDRRVGLLPGDRFYLLDPVPRLRGTGGGGTAGGGAGREFFVSTPARGLAAGGLAWQLTHFHHAPGRPQHLADAVALAAMQAAAGGRPRAVLLVLGPGARDDGGHAPAEVRRFLNRLRVPLVVWWVERHHLDLPARERGPAVKGLKERRKRRATFAETWGGLEEVEDLDDLRQAARRLRRAVDQQRVLWVEGLHLPTGVTLADPNGPLCPVGVDSIRELGADGKPAAPARD